MVLTAFFNFFGRNFSEHKCRPDPKVDPIEFNPGAAINVGYHWLSFFKKLTVPPYAAIPKPPCKPPCGRRCCKHRRTPKPCNVLCKRKRKKHSKTKGCGKPCCYNKTTNH